MDTAADTADEEERADEEDLGSQVMKESIKAELFGLARPDRRIGRFTLLDSIGSGAHGEIYTAYDDRLDRKVAIKLVKADADASDDSRQQRLLLEAMTLARLSHPNVVQVYEAGMFSGRVFLAMEFIRGMSLRAWIAGEADTPEKVRWRRILDKFIQAARGLEAAHKAGLVHRDFKPDNVLVDSDGRVRVVDFGLARIDRGVSSEVAIEAGAGEPDRPASQAGSAPAAAPEHGHGLLQRMARMTTSGGVVGTPAYMSPEQHEARAVDARSDQFSFCVALYEALYGSRPFRAGDLAGLREEVRNGRYVPPERHDGTPGWVWKVLERGLAVDPDDRYPDMGELIAALELDPARQRRRIVTVAVVAAVAAFGFGAGGLIAHESAAPLAKVCENAGHAVEQIWNPARKNQLRAAFMAMATEVPSAGVTWDQVEKRLSRYAAVLAGERVSTCKATRVEATQSEEEYTLQAQCLDRRQRYLGALLDQFARANKATVEHAVESAAGLPRIEVCRNREVLVLGVRPPEDGKLKERVDTIRDHLAGGHTALLVENLDDARAKADAGLRETEDIPYPPVRAEALYLMGRIELMTGDKQAIAQATTLFSDAVDLAEVHHHDEVAADVWLALTQLAIRNDTEPARGFEWARRGLAASRRIGDPARLARALSQSSALHLRDTDPAAGLQDARAALAEVRRVEDAEDAEDDEAIDPFTLADVWHDLANALLENHLQDEAREAFENALRIIRSELGPDHPRTSLLQYDYARLARETGAFDEGRRVLLGVLETWRNTRGANHVQAGHTLRALANLEQEAGNLDKSEKYAREYRDIYEEALSSDDPRRAEPINLVGIIQFRRRQFEPALASYRAALAIQRQKRKPHDPHVLLTRSNVAEVLVKLGLHDEALAELDEFEPLVAVDAPLIIQVLVRKVRGMALLGQGNAGEAIFWLEQALALLENQHHDGLPVERADVKWALAQALERAASKKSARARMLATQARTFYETRGSPSLPDVQAITRWLQQ